MDVRIRDAAPRDAGFLAWVMLAAGRAHVRRGMWEVILGAPERDCLRFLGLLAVTAAPHLFHHSCYLVAETGEVAVSGIGGYDPKVLGHHALRGVLPGVFRQWGRPAPPSMTAGGAPRITACVPPPVEGAWVIESAATLPPFRRMGILSRLLLDMCERGRRRGFRQAQLSIYIGNTLAQRAYEKHGFRLIDERRDPYFEKEIGSPGMALMVCDL